MTAMGSLLEDRDGHEGYGARRLPDRTFPVTWSTATAPSAIPADRAVPPPARARSVGVGAPS